MLSWLRHLCGWKRELACSFCGLPEHQVTNLVAGANAYICDACIDLCSDIIADHRRHA